MNLRQLKKRQQELNGWPIKIAFRSKKFYPYDPFTGEPCTNFISQKIEIITRPKQSWRR